MKSQQVNVKLHHVASDREILEAVSVDGIPGLFTLRDADGNMLVTRRGGAWYEPKGDEAYYAMVATRTSDRINGILY